MESEPIPDPARERARGSSAREWLTGTRPLVGAIGACSLMLLACSWFGLGPGGFGGTRAVGRPAPVRIESSLPTRTATLQSTDISAERRQRLPGRAPHVHSASTRTRPRSTTDSPQRSDATGRAGASDAPSSTPITPATVHSDANTSAPAPTPVIDVGITLPAPADPLPLPATPSTPALPELSVTPPPLPVPDVPVQTVTVGLP